MSEWKKYLDPCTTKSGLVFPVWTQYLHKVLLKYFNTYYSSTVLIFLFVFIHLKESVEII